MANSTGCIYDEERGYAIHTWSAKAFFPQDIRAEDISIEDIAHGLAMTCRYGGQCDSYYSVGQHSIYCWQLAKDLNHPPHLEREALLHDAVEAYLGADFPRPYKMMIPALADFEKMIEAQLNPLLGIPVRKSPEIRFIDETMLSTEMPLLFRTHGAYVWSDDLGDFIYTGDDPVQEGLPQRLPWEDMPSWSPEYAEERFMDAWDEIMILETAA